MASKMVFLMIVVLPMVYSMPVTNLLEESSSPNPLEVTTLQKNLLEQLFQDPSGITDRPEEIKRRSISEKLNLKSEITSEINENQKIRDEASEDEKEDMETAAGTNVLRPLFVYRQQVAYRERMKKARRQAVGSFFR